MSQIIDKLLINGVVRDCHPHPDQIVSPIFLVDKPSGGKRFILNLKHLNLFIEAPHFKLEDYRTMRDLITPGCFGATVDLTDAYYMVPVAETSCKFLRFIFQGRLLEFTCLPMGMSVAPYVFHKIMRPIVECLRSEGVKCVNYLDDYGVLGSSRRECDTNVEKLTALLQYLGFIVNETKSVFTPSQSFKFLGFLFDSRDMTISLPFDKRLHIQSMLNWFSGLTEFSVRQLAKVVGTLVAACPATPYGKLYVMHLEAIKTEFLVENSQNFDAKFVPPSCIWSSIQWWKNNVMLISNRLHNDDYTFVVTTDASLSGWGSSMGEERINGWWSKEEAGCHINLLELRAIELALHHFCGQITNSRILIRSDNTTAISCVNRQGSMVSQALFDVTKRIWIWCEERGNFIFASYIASKENVVADECSRLLPGDTEWSLNDDIFYKITIELGTPTIDLFASAANSKCTQFFAWHPDPRAIGIDAFTHSWKNLKFYAFPPFVLILKVLRKIIADQATGIVVVPDWPAQAWYPTYFDLLRSPPVHFGPNDELLFLPFREVIHPQARSLTLIAGILSGRPT
uniref:Transposon Ty3-I Gag-Pol polyprotein n=1 Tax=Lygus hesperus TaxID=30085 RepID=A0A0A9ZI08_LYGHE